MLFIKNFTKDVALSLLLVLPFCSAFAKTKTYQVEILVFETKDIAALSQGWPLKPGKPSAMNTIHIDSTTEANFSPLAENALKLGVPKSKIEKNYHLILHKGWRQTVTDKENAFGVHVTGGIQYNIPSNTANELKNNSLPVENVVVSESILNLQSQPTPEKVVNKPKSNPIIHPQDQFEVEGIITLSDARQLSIDTDLVFRKPMQLISKNGQMGKFAEIEDRSNWKNLSNAKLQAFRLTDSSRVILSDMHYIDHPLYGVIILVTPEKTLY